MYQEIQLRLPEDDRLREQLAMLKVVYALGINYEMFWGVVINRHNEKPSSPSRENWNVYTIPQWVEFYKRNKIEINEGQLHQILQSLTRYRTISTFIELDKDRFQANHATIIDEMDFMVEKIALFALEGTN